MKLPLFIQKPDIFEFIFLLAENKEVLQNKNSEVCRASLIHSNYDF